MPEEGSRVKIVVVGGGTAGWLSALYIRKRLPSSDITVIDSKDIGIVGVGEATTPYFISFMDYLEIPFSYLVSETDTTIKQSIKFTNWKGDGAHYHHGFALDRSLSIYAIDEDHYIPDFSTVATMSYAKNGSLSPADFHEILGLQKKVAFIKREDDPEASYNPIFNYTRYVDFAAHFDTSKISPVLKRIGIEERSINNIEGTVVDQTLDKNGEVSSLTLLSGERIECDFVIDCTGFSRRFIGKLYESRWKSYKHLLPVDSAIPFSVPMEEKIPTYTEAIAMDYGWMWKIPLQNRYGCGYVFDSNFISEEIAEREVNKVLGLEVEARETLNFSAGYYETPWVKNCLSVGLASGFIEPLESTSIWITMITLSEALKDIHSFVDKNQKFIDEFNKKFCYNNDRIFDFVYLHYLGGRTDTDFWRTFSEREDHPDQISLHMEQWSYRIPSYSDFRDHMFSDFSWIYVASGLGLFDQRVFKESFDKNRLYELESRYNEHLRNQRTVGRVLVDHREFLESLK